MIYQKILQDGFRPTGIVHLGAHHGQEAQAYAATAKFTVWAEANPSLYELLDNHFKKVGGTHLLYKGAITDKDDEEISFYIYNATEASSIYNVGKELNVWYPDHKVDRLVSVPTCTVDTMLKRLNVNVDDIGYLALDIQGAELLALKGATNLLSSANLRYIQTEAIYNEYYDGGAYGGDIAQLITSYGFELMDTERHDATHPLTMQRIARKEIGPVDQMNLLFRRNNV